MRHRATPRMEGRAVDPVAVVRGEKEKEDGGAASAPPRSPRKLPSLDAALVVRPPEQSTSAAPSPLSAILGRIDSGRSAGGGDVAPPAKEKEDKFESLSSLRLKARIARMKKEEKLAQSQLKLVQNAPPQEATPKPDLPAQAFEPEPKVVAAGSTAPSDQPAPASAAKAFTENAPPARRPSGMKGIAAPVVVVSEPQEVSEDVQGRTGAEPPAPTSAPTLEPEAKGEQPADAGAPGPSPRDPAPPAMPAPAPTVPRARNGIPQEKIYVLNEATGLLTTVENKLNRQRDSQPKTSYMEDTATGTFQRIVTSGGAKGVPRRAWGVAPFRSIGMSTGQFSLKYIYDTTR